MSVTVEDDVWVDDGLHVRYCHGHWHVTAAEGNLILPGGPYPSPEAAVQALQRYREAPQFRPAQTETRLAGRLLAAFLLGVGLVAGTSLMLGLYGIRWP